jgi:long-chain acyl-CoA synthetase
MILGASGKNIYPEEVEAVLNRSPHVLEALVYGSADGLTALIHLKPEAIAEALAAVKASVDQAERVAGDLLESIRKEANQRLQSFSRINRVERQAEAFEKTPTQKIKRFMYPRRPTGS